MGIDTPARIHPGADVHPTAQLGAGTVVGDGVTIEEDVVIGRNCRLDPGRDLLHVRKGARIGDGAEILGFSIGKDAELGAEARLAAHTAIGEGSKAGDRLVLERGALVGRHLEAGDDCRLGDRSRLSHCVKLGNGVRTGSGATVQPNTVLADDCSLGDGARVAPGCSVGQRSVVGDLTHVGMDAGVGIIPGARIGDDCVVGHGVDIDGGASIADKAEVGTHGVVFAGARVEHGARMEVGSRLDADTVLQAGETLPAWTQAHADGGHEPRDVDRQDLRYRNGPWPPVAPARESAPADDKPIRQGGDRSVQGPPPRPPGGGRAGDPVSRQRTSPTAEQRSGR